MINKFLWTDNFFRRNDVWKSSKDQVEITREIARNMVKCPSCQRVFEDFFGNEGFINFIHEHRQPGMNCMAKISDMLTFYHVKRSAFLARGN